MVICPARLDNMDGRARGWEEFVIGKMKRRGVRKAIGVYESKKEGSKFTESCVQKTRTLESGMNEWLTCGSLRLAVCDI